MQEVGQRIHDVDIAKHFTPPSFEAKIKQMNGYQSHIVSPEKAVTALIADAFSDCAPIAQWMVVAVRAFLSKSARECASEVVERNPDHRQQLADLIVQVPLDSLNLSVTYVSRSVKLSSVSIHFRIPDCSCNAF